MAKRQLTTIGLLVYATILVTSFLHVLEAFLAYSHPVTLGPLTVPGWVSGVGVALGLDLSILYFSYLSVILPGPGALTAKQASRAAMLLVWFAVLYSMVWEHVAAGRWLEAGVGLLLSLFVPLTSLRVGQLLAEITRMPLEQAEVAEVVKAPPQGVSLTGKQPAEGRVPEGVAAAAQLVKVETHIHTGPQEALPADGSFSKRAMPFGAPRSGPEGDRPLGVPGSPGPEGDRPSQRSRLDPAERAVLQILQQRGYVQVTELMHQLGMGLNRVGEVCGTLEARGLIQRRDGGWEVANQEGGKGAG